MWCPLRPDELRKRSQEGATRNRQDELTHWAVYIYTTRYAQMRRPRAYEPL